MKKDNMKIVIERVERKMLSSANIYGALNYGVWGTILSLYLVLNSMMYLHGRSVSGWIYPLFWGLAFIPVFYVNFLSLKKMEHLKMGYKNNAINRWIMVSGWLVGGIIWIILSAILSTSRVDTFGFLIFIASGNAGILAAIKDYRTSIPIITSLLAIPLIPSNIYLAWEVAVEFVLVGYLISALLYMWGAFTLVGEE